jgi:excinuclease ABC subunit C
VTNLIRHRPPAFESFGPSILAQQTRGELSRQSVPTDRLQARAMLHDHCPLTPGVYGWLDDNQQICYVGKSKSLRKRLLSYFAKTPADKKAERIRQHSQTLVWEPISDELLALIREQELIYRWRPEFNTQGQPTKRQPAFICFCGGPAPNAYFTRRISDKAVHSFGPIAGTGRLRAAVESINQVFQLRDCPDKTKFEFNNQQTLFANPLTAKCIRYELGTCPGPCAGHCSTRDYNSSVDRAIEFVRGKTGSTLKQLDQQMQASALGHSFERAAILRDHLDNLSWLDRRMKALRTAERTFNGVLPIQAHKKRTAWLVLKRGRLVGSAAEPNTPNRALTAIKRLSEISVQTDQLPANIMEMNLQLIMISWFRKYPAMKKTLVPLADAIEICETRLDAAGRQSA